MNRFDAFSYCKPGTKTKLNNFVTLIKNYQIITEIDVFALQIML